MAVAQKYQGDVEAILARRYDNGWDYWTTPDKRLLKDSPFSALGSAKMLLELGMEPSEPILKEVAELIFGAWKEDGRFITVPAGRDMPLPDHPCRQRALPYGICRRQPAPQNY